ncbi:MAG: type II secretion system F family protein [Tumebacillaceae bacterium]
MAGYTYEAYDKTGKKIKGIVSGSDRQAAIQDLKQNLVLIKLAEAKPSIWQKELILGSKRIPLKYFVPFLRQLATLFKAGVPLVESLRILGEQTSYKRLQSILPDLAATVARGNQLSEALREYDEMFPTVFLSMVRAGEVTGNLEDVLDNLATYMEKEHNTREKVKSAMTYPAVISVMSVVTCTFLMVKVIPNFVANLKSSGVPLPWSTRVVLATSHHLVGTWYFYLVGILVCMLLFRYLLKKPKFRFAVDLLKLHVPVFGSLMQKAAIARASRTMATLFKSAVPTLQVFTVAANVVGNEVYSKALRAARDSLRGGNSMVVPLRKEKMFPPLVTQMIAIGEQTGNIDTMFSKIADFYEADVETTVDKLRPLIEPLMILILAFVVGVIVTAVLAPIFEMYQNFGKLH